MTRPPGAGRHLAETSIDYDPAMPRVTRAQIRRVAKTLIGRGLDLDPGNPWGMAHDIAEALGLIPTPPPPAKPTKAYRRSRAFAPASDTEGATS